jgi:hypothetical protein
MSQAGTPPAPISIAARVCASIRST